MFHLHKKKQTPLKFEVASTHALGVRASRPRRGCARGAACSRGFLRGRLTRGSYDVRHPSARPPSALGQVNITVLSMTDLPPKYKHLRLITTRGAKAVSTKELFAVNQKCQVSLPHPLLRAPARSPWPAASVYVHARERARACALSLAEACHCLCWHASRAGSPRVRTER